jgi:hypothetical protein
LTCCIFPSTFVSTSRACSIKKSPMLFSCKHPSLHRHFRLRPARSLSLPARVTKDFEVDAHCAGSHRRQQPTPPPHGSLTAIAIVCISSYL